MKIYRFISFYFILSLSTVYYFGLGLIFLFFLPKEKVIYWAARHWGKTNVKNAGIQLEIFGKENLKKRPAIFIFNHQSMLDTFILCFMAPYKTLPVAKKAFFYFPFLGLFMKWIGAVFVDRHDPQKAMISLRKTQKIVEKNYSIVMAPEGTRTDTGELLAFKRGAFKLALQTKLPLIPITFVNAYQHFPRSAWVPIQGTVKVYIDTPIETKDWTIENLDERIEKVRSIFLNHLYSPTSKSSPKTISLKA